MRSLKDAYSTTPYFRISRYYEAIGGAPLAYDRSNAIEKVLDPLLAAYKAAR